MKILKRITAVTAALLIVFNIAVVNIFAVSGAVIVGTATVAFFASVLLAYGYSQAQIDNMSVTDMQSIVCEALTNGDVSISREYDTKIYEVNINGKKIDVPPGLIGPAISAMFISNAVDYYADYFKPTSTFNTFELFGCGAAVLEYIPCSDGTISTQCLACDYIVVHCNDDGDVIEYKYCSNDGRTLWKYQLLSNGTWHGYAGFSSATRFFTMPSDRTLKFFGDVRLEDGSPFPTDGEYKYQVGELPDDTKVTADMLNPDGSVTIDGVTYYPADYFDPDNLTDEGKKALVGALAGAIANAYVKAEDEPIVDTDEITVEVAEEFQDYAVPVGIANIFPFCIPWDIIRGFQLLNCPAVTPKFEIPFDIPEFGLFPGVKNSITLDFSKYDTYIQIFRWFQIIGFSFLLCKLSLTRVKGAGA